jgi:hypothetical protein
MQQPDAMDTKTSKVASTLTSTVSALAIIGIFVQLYAYIIVRGFLEAYSVDPSEVDITPLNASLRLTFTTVLAVDVLALVSVILALALSFIIPLLVLLFSHSIRRWDIAKKLKILDKPLRLHAEFTSTANVLLANRAQNRLLLAVTLVALFLLAGIYVNDRAMDAGLAALSNTRANDIVSRRILTDLRPRPVVLDWRKPEDTPIVLRDLKDISVPGDSSIKPLFAQLVGRSGDRYVFYIPAKKILVRVEGAAVNITSSLVTR